MRRIIVSMNVTLDGFMSGPGGELDWHFPFWNDELSACACEQLSTMDTILVGRRTYESMAGYWPSALPDYFANLMNSHSKIVISTTLQNTLWNNSRIIKENMAQEIRKLKHQQGKNIIVFGSRGLLPDLLQHDMIDEYRLWVHPVVLGKGHAMFNDLHDKVNLTLLRTKTFSSGVVLMYYHVPSSLPILPDLKSR